ncbi:MAG: hypothetical protein AB7N91_03340 [Candidatus Tectimicrobiota bacterium]
MRFTTRGGRLRLTGSLLHACQYSKRGTITLRVSRQTLPDKAGLLFAVSDTETGRRPEQMGKVLHAFAQADTSTTRPYGALAWG